MSINGQRLDASNLPALARGCAALGAGGGGDPDLSLSMALRAVEEHGPVPVVGLEVLAPEELVMPCGMLGAPTLAEERVWSGDEGGTLTEAVRRLHGRPVQALMCFQIAGANGLLPVTWAARLGLPLVDADGMGRAFPGLHQQAMHLAGVQAAPVVLTDGRLNTMVLNSADDAWADRLARRAVATVGGVCAAALFCMTGAQARRAAIGGSVARALAIGEAIGADDSDRRLEGARAALGATVLIEGTMLDVERYAEGGFARGSATVQGTGSHAARRLRLELQSEFLVALEDGVALATVPDLITVLASESCAPVLTEDLRRGQRVTVLASRAPDVWRGEAALALVGPGAFGYDLAYAPIAEGSGDGPR
jgi:DUF917 family protein